MVRSVEDIVKIPGGGSKPVVDWVFTPITAALEASINTAVAATVAAGSTAGRYDATPTAGMVPYASFFYSAIEAAGDIGVGSGTRWMDYITPAGTGSDTIAYIMVLFRPADSSIAAAVDATFSSSPPSTYNGLVYQYIQSNGALTGGVVTGGAIDDNTATGVTVTAGDRVQLGWNQTTGETFIAVNGGTPVLLTTAPVAVRAEELIPTVLLFSTAATPVFSGGPLDVTFNSAETGFPGYQTEVAPALPDGTKDGDRYKVIGNGGPLFGKALLPGDVIEFIDELSDVIITRFDPNVASPEDLTAALETISTSVAEDIGSLKPIKEIVEDSLTPNLGPNEDGGLVMVGPIPGGTPTNDFEGLAMGSLHRYDDESGTLTEYTPAYGEAFKAWTSLSVDGVSIKPIVIYVGVDDAALMVEDDLFQNTALRRYFDVGYILHPTQEQYLRAKLKSNALAAGDFPGIPGDGGYIIRGTTSADEMHTLEGNGITRHRLPAAVRDSSKNSGSSSFVRTAISPNGIHLAHYSNSDSFTIQHVNLETGSAGNVSGSVTYPRHLAWSRDSQYLFAAHGGLDRVTRWDANGTIPVDAFVSGDNAPMVNSLGVGVIAGETKLYALHGGGGSGSTGGTIDGSISVIDYSDMSVTSTIADAGWGATARILDVHTPDDINEYIYIAAASGAMFIYNVTTSTLETVADALPGDVKDIAFHPDGTKAAIAVDVAPYCVVRDLPLLAINVAHDEPADLAAIPELVEYSSDGSMLAVGGQLYQTLTGMVNVTPAGVPSGWDIKFIPRRR